jgi:PAS domain S-box-containing protein
MSESEGLKKGFGKTMKFAESILSALSVPILVLDGNRRAVVANPAFYRTLQIPPGHLDGKRIHDLISDETSQLHLRGVLEPVLVHAGDTTEVEVVCRLADGERMVLSVSARSVPSENRRDKMLLVELRDITKETKDEDHILALNAALEKYTADLEKANRELDSFSHSASHDLRTPLRLMNKVAYQLLEDHGAQLPADAIDKAEMILSTTREMANLVEDLLNLSKVAREPLKKRRVNMSRLARETVEELQDERQGRDVEIAIDDLAPCLADRTLLKQVTLNLLSNALKFTRPRKRAQIKLGCVETNGEAVYFVRDNGVGFDPSAADKLFLAFQRLHKRDEFEGTGIGLALVSRIVERHGGRIWAEGEIDKGATFYFTLGGGTP